MVLLRLAGVEDLDAVIALVRRVVPVMRASGNLQWDSEYPNSAVFERDVRLGQLWVAEIDGKVAGVAAFTSDQEPEYEGAEWDVSEAALVIHRLAVDPAWQRMGIAAGLLVHAEAVARTRGVPVIRLDTNTQNEASGRLFTKLGYAAAGEIGLSFRPGLRFRCFEKRLR